jgi:two-component system chemotaxis response regulator CheB
MKPISVLIVDDSALMRSVLTDMLVAVPDIEVVGTATDAQDAREKIKQLNPQVLTLDVQMPGMDGLSFLQKIMSLRPMPVIMISTLTQKGADETIRALEMGAVDYVSKPVISQTEQTLAPLREELIAKIRAAAKANLSPRNSVTSKTPSLLSFQSARHPYAKMIAMGSSTGGVEALREIFSVLPANCPPVVMTQHMPEQFTSSFAARLNSLSRIEVAEAYDGAKLESGRAWLAPGNRHLRIEKKGKDWLCRLEDGPPVSGHRPSVDVLFNSVAEAVGADAVGIILTGMGKDGAQGLLKMRQNGAYTIGQNQASCVVYGMPKAAAAVGGVATELPLQDVASHALRYCEQERKASHAS